MFNAILFPESEQTVDKVCEDIVSYILLHYEEDLIDNFYQEKLELYDHLCIELIESELRHYYFDYADVLETIPHTYRTACAAFENQIIPFAEISGLLNNYNKILYDTKCTFMNSVTKKYLVHSAEMILGEISKLVKQECQSSYKNPDYLPNRLRLLIHFLQSELDLDFDE